MQAYSESNSNNHLHIELLLVHTKVNMATLPRLSNDDFLFQHDGASTRHSCCTITYLCFHVLEFTDPEKFICHQWKETQWRVYKTHLNLLEITRQAGWYAFYNDYFWFAFNRNNSSVLYCLQDITNYLLKSHQFLTILEWPITYYKCFQMQCLHGNRALPMTMLHLW